MESRQSLEAQREQAVSAANAASAAHHSNTVLARILEVLLRVHGLKYIPIHYMEKNFYSSAYCIQEHGDQLLTTLDDPRKRKVLGCTLCGYATECVSPEAHVKVMSM
jgi:hypothetical protein